MSKVWILYDGRYYSNPDRASIYEVCDSLKEARENKNDYGTDTVIVECDDDGENVTNSKIVN